MVFEIALLYSHSAIFVLSALTFHESGYGDRLGLRLGFLGLIRRRQGASDKITKYVTSRLIMRVAGKETYMIPESQENRTIELFRATDFPQHWELDRVLMHDIDAVDVTLWAEQGLYWWFLTVIDTRGGGLALLLYSHNIAGEWVYHPSNPISTDIRNARSAGALFRHTGKLIRVSQDCSHN